MKLKEKLKILREEAQSKYDREYLKHTPDVAELDRWESIKRAATTILNLLP